MTDFSPVTAQPTRDMDAEAYIAEWALFFSQFATFSAAMSEKYPTIAAAEGFATQAEAAKDAAFLAANAAVWVSGQAYVAGEYALSPADSYRPYVRQTNGAGATDPSNDTVNWQPALAETGAGAATASGSTAIAFDAAGIIVVTPTNFGQAATLPDATLLTEGLVKFGVRNGGSFPLLIRDFSGQRLAFLDPGATALLSLTDSATSAGSWNVLGGRMFGVDAAGDVTFPSNVASTGTVYSYAVELDDDRTVVFLSGNSGLFVVVHDASTGAFGAGALVRTTASVTQNFKAIKSAANQVLVVSCAASAMEAVTLSVVGTTITVNTASKASFTTPYTLSEFNQNADFNATPMVQVGAAFLFSYVLNSGASPYVCAVTISGDAPSFGAAQPVTGSTVPMIFDMGGGVALTIGYASSFQFKPWTVTGNTLSGGTAASVTATSQSGAVFRKVGSRVMGVYVNTTAYGVVVSLAGTVASASAIQLSAISSVVTSAVKVVGSQLIACFISSNSLAANVLTDNAGVAVAGTPIDLTIANTARLAGWSDSELYVRAITQTPTAAGVFFAFGINGNEPTMRTAPAMVGLTGLSQAQQVFLSEVTGSGLLVGSQESGEFGYQESLAQVFNGKTARYDFALAPAVSNLAFLTAARVSADRFWSVVQVGIYTKWHMRRVRAL